MRLTPTPTENPPSIIYSSPTISNIASKGPGGLVIKFMGAGGKPFIAMLGEESGNLLCIDADNKEAKKMWESLQTLKMSGKSIDSYMDMGVPV